MFVAVFLTFLSYQSFQIADGVCPESMAEGNGLCYDVIERSLTWYDTLQICRHLAKKDFVTALNSGNWTHKLPLRETHCYWVDKNVIPPSKADTGNIFLDLLRIVQMAVDANLCSLMCVADKKWTVEKLSCEKRNYFVCQTPASRFRKKTTPVPPKAVSVPAPPRPKKPVVRHRSRRQVFIETAKGYISGKPLAQGSYPMINACSRFCHTQDGCKVFNYSSETKQCRLFGSVDDCLVEVDEKWVIWAAIIRK